MIEALDLSIHNKQSSIVHRASSLMHISGDLLRYILPQLLRGLFPFIFAL